MKKIDKIKEVYFENISTITEFAELQKSIVIIVKVLNELVERVNLLSDNKK